MAGEGMQRLNTASSFLGEGDPQLIQVKYKTGAKFEGKVVDHKRSGRGLFEWPNGSKYDGDFSDNLRHGKGTQIWSDGSSYAGEFVSDLRHGEGKISWSNGEAYEGTFFKDRRHGWGHYTWPDGSSYKGTFYMDKKEGYGTFTFANGNVFKGLYREDEREGPGVVTYKQEDQQDVGLWRGEKLIKLCSRSSGAFTIESHPEFNYKSEDHISYLEDLDRPSLESSSEAQRLSNYPSTMSEMSLAQLAPVHSVMYPPSALDYPQTPDLSHRINELYSEALDPRSLAVDRVTFDQEFFRIVESKTSSITKKEKTSSSLGDDGSKTPVWNTTPTMVALQRHTLKHDSAKSMMDVDIEAIIRLDRSKFKAKGPLECQSEELIDAAGQGDMSRVESLLIEGRVHPDVADCGGHTALIGATVNWHMDVINTLLNHGANVNKLNDEGCSALSAGTIFYYPIEGFLYNIAERYMSPPEQKPVSDDEADAEKESSALPGILANGSERRASRLMEINRLKLDSKTGSKTVSLSENSKGDVKRRKDGSEIKILKRAPTKERGSDLLGVLQKDDADIFNTEEDDEDGDLLFVEDDEDKDSAYGGEAGDDGGGDGDIDADGPEDFESNQSVRNYHIEVTDQLVERCATQLSHNELVVSREHSTAETSAEVGKARRLAIQISLHERMKDTLELLLKRGANPNSSRVPMPVLFFAIKSADVQMVQKLLMKGADTNTKLSNQNGGLYPIHIAAAIPGEEGVQITELLLDALADPNARALEDDSFLNRNLEEEWSKDVISDASKALLGGRTALQIACARDDNHKNSCRVVRLLLEHKSNTSLICNGFSPLALAIASGNDLAIDELLLFGVDPSLPLTHGVGSALCVATSTEYEHRRTIQGQIHLVDKLVRAGANILAPVPIGLKRITGTAVDYAYYMFNQDRRIAHMPYHALTHAERETYNARRKLLAHVGDIMRTKAVEREKQRNLEEERAGSRSQSPSPNFVYIGAGAKLPPGTKSKMAMKLGHGQGQVTFEAPSEAEQMARAGMRMVGESEAAPVVTRKPFFKYCYECGRSVGVRLAACTRCKEVFYCSKACKLKAWNARHKEECIRIGGRSRSPSPKHRGSSPKSGQGKSDSGHRANVSGKSLSQKSATTEKSGAKHKFRTGTPPYYQYVYIDNYSHN